ncbi:uncharacterized protein LOC106473040 [Limulus polyphemus]|uniref:Uncharacterized protein LOC106473040 n=1 Tax=Limulus polyphemus TaxID=6850 RepID=A0ABM1BUY5_LIMPO|nr:uncharacterized protein LOC106473040 [Limulus polyphemus]
MAQVESPGNLGMGPRELIYKFLLITYILELAWMLVLASLVVITFVFVVSWGLCNRVEVTDVRKQCIDLTQYDFMFPPETKYEDLNLCSEGKVKEFCKDYVEQATIMYILATAACVLVVVSLIGFSKSDRVDPLNNRRFIKISTSK